MSWGQRRRRLTPEETAANVERKRLRDLAAMECQICARRILANTGFIAHHGYERPWNEPGYQTMSCQGARELPYEAAKGALYDYIINVKKQLKSLKLARKRVAAEEAPVIISFRNDWRDKDELHYSMTRATFVEIRAKHENAFIERGWNNFNTILARDLVRRDANIKSVTNHLMWQQGRADRWKETHHFNKKIEIWEKIL